MVCGSLNPSKERMGRNKVIVRRFVLDGGVTRKMCALKRRGLITRCTDISMYSFMIRRTISQLA